VSFDIHVIFFAKTVLVPVLAPVACAANDRFPPDMSEAAPAKAMTVTVCKGAECRRILRRA